LYSRALKSLMAWSADDPPNGAASAAAANATNPAARTP
jgi:hypothetical protein